MDGQRFDQLTRTMASGASRRRVLGGLAAAVTAAAGLRAGSSTGFAADADVCSGLDSGKVDVTDPSEPTSIHVCADDFEAGEGLCITGYCVKAGSKKQNLGPEFHEVSPAQECVDITHSSGKAISHYSLTFGPCPDEITCADCLAHGTDRVLCLGSNGHKNKCCPVVANADPCGQTSHGTACCGGEAACTEVPGGNTQICEA
jgi:hypothetical protein